MYRGIKKIGKIKRFCSFIFMSFLFLGNDFGFAQSVSFMPMYEIQYREEIKKDSSSFQKQQLWNLSGSLQLFHAAEIQVSQNHFKLRVEKLIFFMKLTHAPKKFFHRFSEFVCTPFPWPGFSTWEGMQVFSKKAVLRWKEKIKWDLERLSYQFQHLSSPSKQVLEKAKKRILKDWKKKQDVFLKTLLSSLKKQRWSWYLKKAKKQKLCQEGPKWDGSKLMVFLKKQKKRLKKTTRIPSHRVLFQKPARFWNGMYAFLAKIETHTRQKKRTRTVSVLLDPTEKKSKIFFPLFAFFSYQRGALRLGKGQKISYEFLKTWDAFHQKRFRGSDFLGTCCDIILGQDVLSHFVLELRPAPKAEVIFYQKKHFSPSWKRWKPVPWAFESRTRWFYAPLVRMFWDLIRRKEKSKSSSRGRSSSRGARETRSFPPAFLKKERLTWMLWDLTFKKAPWKGTQIKPVPTWIQASSARIQRFDLWHWSQKRMLLDLSRGVLWFFRKDFFKKERPPIWNQHVVFEFVSKNNKRSLWLKEGGSVPFLKKIKTKKKSKVLFLEIQGKDASEWDLWDVYWVFSGGGGRECYFKWSDGEKDVLQRKVFY